MPELCNICLKTNQLILLRAYSGNSVINMKTKVSKHTLIRGYLEIPGHRFKFPSTLAKEPV